MCITDVFLVKHQSKDKLVPTRSTSDSSSSPPGCQREREKEREMDVREKREERNGCVGLSFKKRIQEILMLLVPFLGLFS